MQLFPLMIKMQFSIKMNGLFYFTWFI